MSGEQPTISTRSAVVAADRQWLRTGFDLHIISRGVNRRLPLCYSHMTIGKGGTSKRADIVVDEPGVAPRQALLKLIQGQIFFNNTNPKFPILINGEIATFRQLKDQDELQLGQTVIKVVRLKDTVAFLEGYSDPYQQMSWRLEDERITLGRSGGSRKNTIVLDDPSVSREHATIVSRLGIYVLQAENEATWVNAEPLEGHRVLKDEDLIQLGRQLLRFRLYKAMTRPREMSPKDATILFSDIWDYTRMAETYPLEQTIEQLNQVYRVLGKVIMERDGILMTYLGDAMMAVFGAEGDDEQHAVKAVEAAIGMLDKLQELNESWRKTGLPELRIGVGICTGEVMVGDVGVTGHREFAAMGDTTNLASRIEKLTREFNAGILISASTQEMVKGHFKLRSLGAVNVKGRRSKVELYEVIV